MMEVSHILNAMEAGDPKAAEQLLPLVYDELRKMAAAQMAYERPRQTLNATALVHEAWLRLMKSPAVLPVTSRRYFFVAAAEAMRRILVESARRKRAVRHGGQLDRQVVELDQLQHSQPEQDELLAVHEALDRLSEHDPLKAELVKLRYLAGFTNEEACDILGINPKSGEKQWVYARAWLKSRLSS